MIKLSAMLNIAILAPFPGLAKEKIVRKEVSGNKTAIIANKHSICGVKISSNFNL